MGVFSCLKITVKQRSCYALKLLETSVEVNFQGAKLESVKYKI
jgi:hypothetical protein